MGFVYVDLTIFAPSDGGRTAQVHALVDTGAIMTMVPESVLVRLGIEPVGSRRFRAIDQRVLERRVGQAKVAIDGQPSEFDVPIIFGDDGDDCVVGVTTLEVMGLTVDPARGELRPTDLLLLRAGR